MTSAIIALPLFADEKPAGVMVLFAQEKDFFDDQEIVLLSELAGDVSFALQYIEREEKIDYLAFYDSLTRLPTKVLTRVDLPAPVEPPTTVSSGASIWTSRGMT